MAARPGPGQIHWPGSVGFAQVQFAPASATSESILKRVGPWAWFRLLDAAELRGTSSADRRRLVFDVGGRTGTFQMINSMVNNPFELPALRAFRCPESF